MIFNHAGASVAVDQMEHEQIYPKPGWVEHDPMEIWARTQDVIKGALRKANITHKDIAAVGITNQRDDCCVGQNTGKPLHNAVVWMDTRNGKLVADLTENSVGRMHFGRKPVCHFATWNSGLQSQMAAGKRPRRTRSCRSGQRPVRQHRHLGHLESDRRRAWRRPCHRCDQRQPHDAHESGNPRLGSGTVRCIERTDEHVAYHQIVLRNIRIHLAGWPVWRTAARCR